jgi:FkbM family methyltransferase
MVIYIDLGCSDGKSIRRFLDGQSFLPELARICDKVYGFDPVRYPEWSDIEPKRLVGHASIGDAIYEPTSIEFFECAAGNARGVTNLSITANPNDCTHIALNDNYNRGEKKLVKMIDFAVWLKEHVRMEDTVIVKMDIEGAEYEVLEKLTTSTFDRAELRHGEYTAVRLPGITYINRLFVEFHSHLFMGRVEEYKEREKRIRQECPIPIEPYNSNATLLDNYKLPAQ